MDVVIGALPGSTGHMTAAAANAILLNNDEDDDDDDDDYNDDAALFTTTHYNSNACNAPLHHLLIMVAVATSILP